MKLYSVSLVCVPFLCSVSYAAAIPIDLGSASSFAILAGSTVTNTGPTVINGDIGVSPGSAVTGFPPGIVNGTIDSDNSVAVLAEIDLASAYNVAAAETCGVGNSLTGKDMGGLILTPGVYCFASSAQLTGTLTLDALGDPGAVFVIQIGSTLTTISNSSVAFVNGARGSDVFWQVGSSATIGTATDFAGTILALTSITLTTGADIADGRALAINGAVTLDTNRVSASPEPGSTILVGMGLLLSVLASRYFARPSGPE